MAVFFLGGCDLEMVAIKRILKKYNQKFVDKNLKWGAKLSDYKDELEKYKNEQIYAIELDKDIEAKNVIFIDHHNELFTKPSSIEQVAALFNHRLSAFEKAVALNDKGYIYEMLRNGINLSDIKRIRKLDRKAQGVSEEEEEAAKNIELKRIIYFPYSHFSPLTDRIFFEKGWRQFIIYNDNLTMFYGLDIEKLKKTLNRYNLEASFWGRGFLGVLERIEEKILYKIFNEVRKEKSIHIFMLPFVIENKDIFNKKLQKEWQKRDFNFSKDKLEYYNDYIYFYPHVRDILFGLNDGMSVYYEKKLGKNNKYIISLKSKEKFELDIEDISLRKFNNSIGILSFHLVNYEYDYEDILKINEFGRRIFPQFLDRIFFVENTKRVFLADSIEIVLDDKLFAKEDFERFNNDNFDINVKNVEKSIIPSFIYKLIGDGIKLIIDDRMFVVSFYIDDGEVVDELVKFDGSEYSFLYNDWWYKYVFVDGYNKTCQNQVFCKEILNKSTYYRWIDKKTLFGISRYSFVGISKRDFFSENVLIFHFKTMYYQMMVLLLMYRAMIVYFSDKVQDIVGSIKSKRNKNDRIVIARIKDKSEELYKEYLKFLNGLYFREVTPQEQGIELYKKALMIMEIENEIKDFDREINELDSYIEILAEKERNKELEKLNKLGALFLPPTFLASLLGMNVGGFDSHKDGLSYLFVLLLLLLSVRAGELQFINDKNERILEKIFDKIGIDENREKFIIIGAILLGILFLGY